jgi:hypothetical protein
MDEITIQIDYHESDIFDTGEPMEWYTAFVTRDNQSDILWYGLCFDTYEEAESAAREYLRKLVSVKS